MVKVVVVEGQVLTEVFIRKRIQEQYDYLKALGGESLMDDRAMEKWESAKDRYYYFEDLINKLKQI